MNTNIETKLLNELHYLREKSPNIYLNLKSNISATYKMYWMMTAEREFLSGAPKSFTCYKVFHNVQHTFRKYCEIKKDFGALYFFVSHDKCFAASYYVADDGMIASRDHWYRKDTIEDILLTFQNDLIVCKAGEYLMKPTIKLSA